MFGLQAVLIAATVALALPAAAQECSHPAKPMLRAELMFGRHIGGRLGVSERQWTRFVARELTPRFPDGLTVLDAQGQWRDRARNAVVREPSKIVIVLIADEASARERLAAAAAAYKARFKQQSVAVLTRPVCAAF